MKKRTLAMVLAVLMLCSVCFTGCGNSKEWNGKHNVEMVIKNYGTITLQINADVAPQTASNFLNLAKRGFYNGTTIYRAIDGFAIYGGDPQGNGTGTSGTELYGEFTSNGFNNTLSNSSGAIGMARGTNKNSASCQFYILENDATWLDGDFAVFGYVVDGMDVVRQIASGAAVTGTDGYIAKSNQPVISSVKVVT